MEKSGTNLIAVTLGSGETRSVFVLDAGQLCYAYYKPETTQQFAKPVLDSGASQLILRKQDAEQVYRALTDASLW